MSVNGNGVKDSIGWVRGRLRLQGISPGGEIIVETGYRSIWEGL